MRDSDEMKSVSFAVATKLIFLTGLLDFLPIQKISAQTLIFV